MNQSAGRFPVSPLLVRRLALPLLAVAVGMIGPLVRSMRAADADIPELTAPVNDFAKVIDPQSAMAMDRLIRQLQQATGDTIAVATVQTVEPYADVREYAVKMFENRGRGIGEKGKDNGLLILLAIKERNVRIEVGYGLEEWITDGFAGETSREYMRPAFREGRYGAGLLAGVTRVAARIAQGRGISLEGLPALARPQARPVSPVLPISAIAFFAIVILALVIAASKRGPPGGGRHWGGSGWSGWSSGVGPFGGGSSSGGFGGGFGGFGGGGFGGGGSGGGGFGGFGGGRSGGGGGGASW